MTSRTVRFTTLTIALLLIASMAFAQTPAVDDYDVTVVFLGLMTYDLSTPKTVSIIAPDAKTGFKKLGEDEHPVHSHVAYILAGLDQMPPTAPLNRNHAFRKPDEGEDRFHYLDLNGEQISVDDDNLVSTLNDPLDIKTDDCTPPCPNAGNKNHLCWLAGMAQVHDPTVDPLRKADKYFNRMPSATDVAARTVVRYGTLEAHIVGFPDKNDNNILKSTIWKFVTPELGGGGTDVKLYSALPQEIHWNFKAKGVPFVLNLNGFNGAGRRVAFMPTFPDSVSRGTLLIVIGNTAQEDTGPVSVVGAPVIDEHYSVYHRFIDQNDPGFGRIPHPTNEKCNAYLFEPALKPKTVTAPVSAPMPPAAIPSQPGAHAHGKMKQAAKAETVPSDGGQPTPGGLNCFGNSWP